jgi:hypothetical protein
LSAASRAIRLTSGFASGPSMASNRSGIQSLVTVSLYRNPPPVLPRLSSGSRLWSALA